MEPWDCLDLEDFLSRNPGLRLTRFGPESLTIQGEHLLCAQLEGCELVQKRFELSIEIQAGYPKVIPTVYECAGVLPRNQDHHTYQDGSFCLGSELRLRLMLNQDSSLSAFLANIVDPFLYSVTYYLQHGFYPYGQLAHGEEGLVEDYERLFGVSGRRAVVQALLALSKRKRIANRLSCPCGCSHRLGLCDYRFKLNKWRPLDQRRFYREQLKSFGPSGA